MADITDVEVDVVDGGCLVVPASETKKVVIPSPPTVNYVPINPRPGVIYLASGDVAPGSDLADALSAYAKENKVVFICPATRDVDDMLDFALYAERSCKKYNIKKDSFSVAVADEADLEVANELVEALCDEDWELDDAEVLAI